MIFFFFFLNKLWPFEVIRKRPGTFCVSLSNGGSNLAKLPKFVHGNKLDKVA